MPSASVLKTAHEELLSFFSIGIVLIVAALYWVFSVVLLNYRLFLFSPVPFINKLQLLIQLLPGVWTGLSLIDFLLFALTAILVGYNILLLFKSIMFLRHKGKLRLSIGGATLIALITTGCLSCGLSVLSILGLSASLSFLPFRGLELHILSVVLLIFSFAYMFWEIHRVKYCKVK